MTAPDFLGWALAAIAGSLVIAGTGLLFWLRFNQEYWSSGKKSFDVWFLTLDRGVFNTRGERILDLSIVLVMIGAVMGFGALLVLARDSWSIG